MHDWRRVRTYLSPKQYEERNARPLSKTAT